MPKKQAHTIVALALSLLCGGARPAFAEPVEIKLPAQPLSTALREFARQAGIQVAVQTELTSGKTAPSLNGKYEPAEALSALLKGTGLTAYPVKKNTYGIRETGDTTPASERLHQTSYDTGASSARLAQTDSVSAAQIPQGSEGRDKQSSTEAGGNPLALQEIVVSAQRRTVSLQQVPVSVSVLNGDTLAKANIHSLADLSSQIASVKIAPGPAADQLHVRGFGSGFNPGFEQSVATFVDGAYRNRSRSSRVALFDVDRVEILKGPQTLYFGANAIAGALNITTRKPTDVFEANASAFYGRPDGERDIEGGVSLPLSQELSVRVAGRYAGADGYIHNQRFGSTGPDLDTKQGRVSVHLSHANLTVDARYDVARVRDTDSFDTQIVGCPPPGGLAAAGLCARALGLFPAFDDKLNLQSDSGTRTFNYIDLGEGAMTARLGFDLFAVISSTAFANQAADNSVNLIPFPGLSPIGTMGYLPIQTDEKFHQFSQELRMQSEGQRTVEYMFGAYFESNHLGFQVPTGNFFRNFAGAPPLVPFMPTNTPIISINGSQQTSKSLSGFGSLTYHATEQLSVTGGVRYTRVEKDAARSLVSGTGGYFDNSAPFVPFAANVQPLVATVIGGSLSPYPVSDRTDHAFMPSATVKYQIAAGAMTYVSFTKGFKAGGFSATSVDTFKPEFVNNYEAGIKATLFDGRLTTNLALFRSDFTNLQEASNGTTVSGAPVSIITNVASSKSQGVEFEGKFRAHRDLTLSADVAYINSHYESYPNAPCNPLDPNAALGAGCRHDASGQQRDFAPKWSGAVGAEYRHSLTSDLELGLGATLSFTSDYYMQPIATDLVRQPGYGKLDVHLGVSSTGGRWEAALVGRNLTNKTTAAFRNYTPAAPGTVTAFVDRPRTYGLQLSGRW